MSRRAVVLVLALFGIVLPIPRLSGQELEIAHQALPCVVSASHPVIAAELAPVEDVARGRVLFRSDGPWFSVSLDRRGDGWTAFLPAPQKKLRTFEYQIEAVGIEGRTTTSLVHRVTVASDRRACAEPAPLRPTEELLVTQPAGAAPSSPLVPSGFSRDRVAGNAGVFDLGTRAALLGGAVAGGGALAVFSLRSGSDGEGASISFVASTPPSGSVIAAGSPLRVQLQVSAHDEVLSGATARVDIRNCTALETRVPLLGLDETVMVTLEANVILFATCPVPVTVDDIVATIETPMGVRATQRLPLAYTLTR